MFVVCLTDNRIEYQTMKANNTEPSAKTKLQDISAYISWFVFAQTYFGKSYSWFIKKFKGYDGQGKPSCFNEEEREALRAGLQDLSERIRKASELI